MVCFLLGPGGSSSQEEGGNGPRVKQEPEYHEALVLAGASFHLIHLIQMARLNWLPLAGTPTRKAVV